MHFSQEPISPDGSLMEGMHRTELRQSLNSDWVGGVK